MTKSSVTIIDAPLISLDDSELAGDVLLKFYRSLGWDGKDMVDPCKVRTTKEIYNRLYDVMLEKCPDAVAVGMAMVNRGPGVDDNIPHDKVYLYEGWVAPEGA